MKIENINFTYPTTAFSLNISALSISSGEIIGVVGANGAGKTSLFNVMLGLFNLSDVQMSIDGKQYQSFTESPLKITLHNAMQRLNNQLNVIDEVKLVAGIYAVENLQSRIEEVAKQLNITELLNKRVGHLSSGQLQKVLWLRTLLTEPDILLLDEPTTALDVAGVEQILSWINQLANKGTTIFIATHHPYDLVRLRPRIIGLQGGCLVADHQFNESLCDVHVMRELIGEIVGEADND